MKYTCCNAHWSFVHLFYTSIIWHKHLSDKIVSREKKPSSTKAIFLFKNKIGELVHTVKSTSNVSFQNKWTVCLHVKLCAWSFCSICEIFVYIPMRHFAAFENSQLEVRIELYCYLSFKTLFCLCKSILIWIYVWFMNGTYFS